MKIEHDKIKVTKVCHRVYSAKTNILDPIKTEIVMNGETAESAKEKLELFLDGKPYKHIK